MLSTEQAVNEARDALIDARDAVAQSTGEDERKAALAAEAEAKEAYRVAKRAHQAEEEANLSAAQRRKREQQLAKKAERQAEQAARAERVMAGCESVMPGVLEIVTENLDAAELADDDFAARCAEVMADRLRLCDCTEHTEALLRAFGKVRRVAKGMAESVAALDADINRREALGISDNEVLALAKRIEAQRADAGAHVKQPR